jgi:DUF4097 and DUF4098 domain-containing protein YvlB
MQQITEQVTGPGRAGRPRGRWIWRLSGIAVVAAGTAVIGVTAGTAGAHDGDGYRQTAFPSRTVVVNGTVTSLNIHSYGAPIQVSSGSVNQVTVAETISQPGPADVTATDDGGDLTLAAPGCQNGGCSVGFSVIVPASFPAVTVSASSEGGPVRLSGTAAANIDSGGGPVSASDVHGLLTVTAGGGAITASGAGSATLDSGSGHVLASAIPGPLDITSEGGRIDVHDVGAATLDSGSGPVSAAGVLGPLAVNSSGGSINVTGLRGGATLDSGSGDVVARSVDGSLSATTSGGRLQVEGLAGPLTADTGSGNVTASGVASVTARVSTSGGSAWMSFTRAPRSVQVTTGSGDAVLVLPGGPYAVTANSAEGPELVSVPVSPKAASTVTVSTSGGQLQVKPPAGGS